MSENCHDVSLSNCLTKVRNFKILKNSEKPACSISQITKLTFFEVTRHFSFKNGLNIFFTFFGLTFLHFLVWHLHIFGLTFKHFLLRHFNIFGLAFLHFFAWHFNIFWPDIFTFFGPTFLHFLIHFLTFFLFASKELFTVASYSHFMNFLNSPTHRGYHEKPQNACERCIFHVIVFS